MCRNTALFFPRVICVAFYSVPRKTRSVVTSDGVVLEVKHGITEQSGKQNVTILYTCVRNAVAGLFAIDTLGV